MVFFLNLEEQGRVGCIEGWYEVRIVREDLGGCWSEGYKLDGRRVCNVGRVPEDRNNWKKKKLAEEVGEG